MSERRRDEIALKRQKLAELRKARAERLERKQQQSPPPAQDSYKNRDINALLEGILGSDAGGSSGIRTPDLGTPTSSAPGTPLRVPRSISGIALRRGSDAGSSTLANTASDAIVDRAATPRFAPELIDVEQELFELPQRERVMYNKEIQTATFDSSDEESPPHDTGGVGTSTEDVRREREREAALEAAREAELEAESVQLDREIAQEIRDLTEEERTSIFAAPEFLDFVEQSSKIVQRALNDNYDYIRDYSVGTETGGDDSEGKRVKRVCAFWDERYCKNRSITDLDWSPKYPELSVASYNKNPAALNEPDGIVAVWNMHLLERPEFVFHSQSDVLSVTFSPFHSNLVFGGTYSGQILLWDTRSKHLPVLKTPLSAAGHTHPVYAMQMVGTQNAHNLITSSTDGLVCSWLVDMLAQPQETLELVHAGHNKTGEVAITALDFPDNETSTFWIGTEEGNLYQANRHDRAGAKAGLNAHDVYRAHAGPVTGLHFHPADGPVDFSDLFLSCSVDWTVKLWRARGLTNTKPSTGGAPTAVPPLYSFDEADDYVYDVKWHPTHPAVFGAVDGSGKFDLWNLNIDTEVPAVRTAVSEGHALNKMRWDHKDGRRVAMGGSEGRLHVYDIGDMAIPRETEWNDLQKTVASFAGASSQEPEPLTSSLRGSVNGR
ncbi:cytoplasmic dynein intermediate chain [Vararia minispora EC-137]|uniref:Cytoplasmic dynein intermediate chain n=1 Tax=Vararia minispora EC-137 TaxID=1314806 RepID=A0ACB8QPQ2_9AGAM|nr:cytoplasmic dynein intermediate chain [Vararia minispora EC-137]